MESHSFPLSYSSFFPFETHTYFTFGTIEIEVARRALTQRGEAGQPPPEGKRTSTAGGRTTFKFGGEANSNRVVVVSTAGNSPAAPRGGRRLNPPSLPKVANASGNLGGDGNTPFLQRGRGAVFAG